MAEYDFMTTVLSFVSSLCPSGSLDNYSNDDDLIGICADVAGRITAARDIADPATVTRCSSRDHRLDTAAAVVCRVPKCRPTGPTAAYQLDTMR